MSKTSFFGIGEMEPSFGVGIIADECNESIGRMLVSRFKKKYLDPHNMKLGTFHLATKQKLADDMDDVVAAYNRYDAPANKPDTVSLLTTVWPVLAWTEMSADFVIFGPIEDPILKKIKELILLSAQTFETIFYHEFTIAVVHRRKVYKFLNLPILSNDEITDICKYDLSVFSHTEGLKELTSHGEAVERSRMYKLTMNMISAGCTSDEIVRVQKYCRVILDSIKCRLDYKKAKQELGISELMKKYGVSLKEEKKNG
jgi:hypothetical protein